MLELKEEIDGMTTSIKNIKKEMDDELQQALMKSSSLVEINKNMEEIQLAGQLILTSIKDNNMKAVEKLLRKLRRKIHDTQILLAKGIQKSMLKATQDLAEAENGIMLINSLDDMANKFNFFEEKIRSINIFTY
jgi:predicted GTPase